jgi:hypothetical protein
MLLTRLGVMFAASRPVRELADQAPEMEEWLLPHVGVAHRGLLERPVFEDVMQQHARHVIDSDRSAAASPSPPSRGPVG